MVDGRQCVPPSDIEAVIAKVNMQIDVKADTPAGRECHGSGHSSYGCCIELSKAVSNIWQSSGDSQIGHCCKTT